jgi:hypothetical protein
VITTCVIMYIAINLWPKEEGVAIASGPVPAVDVTDGRSRQAFAGLSRSAEFF